MKRLLLFGYLCGVSVVLADPPVGAPTTITFPDGTVGHWLDGQGYVNDAYVSSTGTTAHPEYQLLAWENGTWALMAYDDSTGSFYNVVVSINPDGSVTVLDYSSAECADLGGCGGHGDYAGNAPDGGSNVDIGGFSSGGNSELPLDVGSAGTTIVEWILVASAAATTIFALVLGYVIIWSVFSRIAR